MHLQGETYMPRVLFLISKSVSEEALSQADLPVEKIFAGQAEEVLDLVSSEQTDLCVLEASDTSVRRLCDDLRKTPRGAVIPILLIGGEGTALEDIEEAVQWGADGFWDQGAPDTDLEDRIATILGLEASEDDDAPSMALAKMEEVSSDKSYGESEDREPRHPVDGKSLNEIIATVEREHSRLMEESLEREQEISEGLDTLDPKTYLHKPATIEPDPDDPPEVSMAPEPIPSEEPTIQESDEQQMEAGEPTEAGGEDGRLEMEPLWSVLASLRSRRATGVLTLVSRNVERKIFIEEGEPTMATSSAREDRLIELLHREGRLNERQYEQAAMTIGASGRRAGVVLVEKGLIASRELFPLVRHHYETIIFDSFAWSEGSWRFTQGKHRSSERVLLDLPMASIIVEGLRSRAPLSEIRKIVASDARPKNTGGGICALEETRLSDRELEPLEWLDGTRGVDELAERFNVVADDMCALIAGLAVLGWVQVTGGDKERPAKDAQGGENLWTDVDRRQESRIEMARVVDKLAQVEQGNYFAIMQVAPEASGHEIRKAYRRLRGLFAIERFVTPELLDLQPAVKEIRFVMDEAYEILRNASLREAYRATMSVE
jgi:DNA-binding response OmpR family regulator